MVSWFLPFGIQRRLLRDISCGGRFLFGVVVCVGGGVHGVREMREALSVVGAVGLVE